jgi:transcriptional antiterminator RfaH
VAPYWAAALAEPQRERVAQKFLQLAGYTVYLPRLRAHRVNHGRKVETRQPLFPGYLFVEIVVGFWDARYCPGTRGLVMNCGMPVRVPEAVIGALRAREVGGLVELPRRDKFRTGEPVRVISGPFSGHCGLVAGMRAHERVAILLAILGAQQRVTLAADAVEAE